jgi:hypothetical protein
MAVICFSYKFDETHSDVGTRLIASASHARPPPMRVGTKNIGTSGRDQSRPYNDPSLHRRRSLLECVYHHINPIRMKQELNEAHPGGRMP